MKVREKITEKEYKNLVEDGKNISFIGIPITEMDIEELRVVIAMAFRINGGFQRIQHQVPIKV